MIGGFRHTQLFKVLSYWVDLWIDILKDKAVIFLWHLALNIPVYQILHEPFCWWCRLDSLVEGFVVSKLRRLSEHERFLLCIPSILKDSIFQVDLVLNGLHVHASGWATSTVFHPTFLLKHEGLFMSLFQVVSQSALVCHLNGTLKFFLSLLFKHALQDVLAWGLI